MLQSPPPISPFNLSHSVQLLYTKAKINFESHEWKLNLNYSNFEKSYRYLWNGRLILVNAEWIGGAVCRGGSCGARVLGSRQQVIIALRVGELTFVVCVCCVVSGQQWGRRWDGQTVRMTLMIQNGLQAGWLDRVRPTGPRGRTNLKLTTACATRTTAAAAVVAVQIWIQHIMALHAACVINKMILAVEVMRIRVVARIKTVAVRVK